MQATTLRRGVAAALAGTGALHLALAPEYLSEQTYVGTLFIAGGISALALAVITWFRNDARALLGGAAIAGGMALGFVLSRTTGLPGFHEAEWEGSGLVSLLLEGFVVGGVSQLLRAAPLRRMFASG
jgi:hypothetical protein